MLNSLYSLIRLTEPKTCSGPEQTTLLPWANVCMCVHACACMCMYVHVCDGRKQLQFQWEKDVAEMGY